MTRLHDCGNDDFDDGNIADEDARDEGADLKLNNLKQSASQGNPLEAIEKAKPATTSLDEGSLGSVLKNVYRDTLEEEVPESLMDLLNRLD